MEQSDRAQFDRALTKLLSTTNGQQRLSPTQSSAFWFALKGQAWPAIAAAMTRLISSHQGHVSPATILAECQPDQDAQREAASVSRGKQLQHRMDAADQAAIKAGIKRFGQALWHNPEFQSVKHVANPAYGRRCTGVPPANTERLLALDPGLYHTYTGEFDFMAVVNAAPLPKGKRPDDHQRSWEYFWQLLREEFQLYQNRQRVHAGVDELVEHTKPGYLKENQQVTDPSPDAL